MTLRIKTKKLILTSCLLFPLPAILLSVSNTVMIPTLILLLGIGFGVSRASVEGILAKITDYRSYGTDIGLLMIGVHVGNTVSTALSGFIVASYGFGSVFLLSALLFVFYSIAAYKSLK